VYIPSRHLATVLKQNFHFYFFPKWRPVNRFSSNQDQQVWISIFYPSNIKTLLISINLVDNKFENTLTLVSTFWRKIWMRGVGFKFMYTCVYIGSQWCQIQDFLKHCYQQLCIVGGAQGGRASLLKCWPPCKGPSWCKGTFGPPWKSDILHIFLLFMQFSTGTRYRKLGNIWSFALV